MIENDGDDIEAPISPVSKLILKLYSPNSEEIIHCAMSFRHPIDVEALKKAFANSIMIRHPRFCSLIVRNPNNGDGKLWRKINVNIDDHFFVHYYPTNKSKTKYDIDNEEEEDDEKEAAINSFLAEISVSSPLGENKPLWEVHVLVGLKCVVLRVHHALGDGVSLMSMLSACFGKKNDDGSKNDDNVVDNTGDCSVINHNNSTNNVKGSIDRSGKKGVWWLMKSLWYTIVFMLRNLGRILWVKDEVSVVSGGDGVELWPRKLATTKFLLEDFKSVKMVIPQVTINDVLLGVISSGLSKYLNAKSPQAVQQTRQLTAVIAVNLRKNPHIQ
ncbi:O-acyltransferase WSD1, partial [Bienertia sinuspersici]